jgi:glycosyltransferase involved in cell wall biosynthesis
MMETRILYVTEDHSVDNTGVTGALDALVRQVSPTCAAEIIAIGPQSIEPPPGVELFELRSEGVARAWRMAAGQNHLLRAFIGRSDIVHLHGVWMWPQWAAAREAHRKGVPFILTTHGMLERWTFERQSWPHRLKKTLYWNLLAYPAFKHAARLHALTPNEAGTLRGYFPHAQIVTIPNGVALDEIDRALAELPPRDAAEPAYFLFLGRLHPKKGIHLLIEAFAQLPRPEFQLKIAGPTQPREAAYAAGLPRLAQELGLGERVHFTGPVTGADKWRLYRDAHAFCLPTFSEGMPLVNLEAAACGTPVLTTPASGVLAEWEGYGGMLFPPEVEAVGEALRRAAGWTEEERRERGEAMRRLVEAEYDWKAVRPRWEEVYEGVRRMR